jgi:hypothetical protein
MELIHVNLYNFLKTAHPLVYIGLLLLFSYAGGKDSPKMRNFKEKTGNAKEIPVLDNEKKVVADLTILDLLRFIANFTEHG